MKYKFGLIIAPTNNLGDWIQSLAAKQFLPRVDIYLDRENLNSVSSEIPIKTIMNGWFLHNWRNWPPSSSIKPLFISFHLTSDAMKHLLSSRSMSYFKAHEPIGCRDYFTFNFFKTNNIAAYFSGCLTLTLKKPEVERDNSKVIIVDIEPKILDKLPKDIIKRAKFLTHYFSYPIDKSVVNVLKKMFGKYYSVLRETKFFSLLRKGREKLFSIQRIQEKIQITENFLKEYASAGLIITSRLHCALVGLAFDTPTIFLASTPNDERFKGYEDLLNIFSYKEISKIDWDYLFKKNTHEKERKLLTLKQNLIKKCETFIKNEE